MATILHSVTQQRLYIEVTVNQTEKKAWILGKYVVLSRTFGVGAQGGADGHRPPYSRWRDRTA